MYANREKFSFFCNRPCLFNKTKTAVENSRKYESRTEACYVINFPVFVPWQNKTHFCFNPINVNCIFYQGLRRFLMLFILSCLWLIRGKIQRKLNKCLTIFAVFLLLFYTTYIRYIVVLPRAGVKFWREMKPPTSPASRLYAPCRAEPTNCYHFSSG